MAARSLRAEHCDETGDDAHEANDNVYDNEGQEHR